MKNFIDDEVWKNTALGSYENWPDLLKTTFMLIRRSPLPIGIHWGDQRRLLYNEAYAQFAENRHPSILGLPAHEAWPEIILLQDYIEAEIKAGRSVSIANQYFASKASHDGFSQDIWVDVHYSPLVENNSEQIMGVLAIITNITKYNVTANDEGQLSTKALERVIGGIAHDFNNLLAGINGNLELMKCRLKQNRTDQLNAYIEGAHQAASRAIAITNNLLSFSRQQILAPQIFDLNHFLERLSPKIKELMQPPEPYTIKYMSELSSSLPLVYCDPHQLEEALLNICQNCRDALPTGGCVTFKTSTLIVDPDTIHDQSILPGCYTALSVIDDGEGMNEKTLKHAFDPFFTTRPLGHGNGGLGLSMTYGFIRQSEGYVLLTSDVGKGTTLQILLPTLPSLKKKHIIKPKVCLKYI